jgi:hypothetical protein
MYILKIYILIILIVFAARMLHFVGTVSLIRLKIKCMSTFRRKVCLKDVAAIYQSLADINICNISSETGIGASEALKKALRDVMTMCDHVKDTFEESENDYYAAGGTGH